MLVPSNYKDVNRMDEENVFQDRCFNSFDRLLFFKKQKRIINAIERQVEENKPDLLHAHFLFTNGYACMRIGHKHKIPYIVAVRNTDLNVFFKHMFFLRNTGIEVLLNAEKIVFISSSYKNSILSKYIPQKYKDEINEKSIVIPNGIDKFWLINATLKNNIDKEIHLLTVGSINRNKNQLTVVKAAELLISKGYKVRYTVIGKVEDKVIHKELMKRNFVVYIENQPKEKLINYYRKSNIFVMPSKTETFGLVYAEAMSQGLPVIYTRGQGFDNQFDEGEVGYSVNFSSIEEIACRTIDIIHNYKEMSKNCLEKVDKFNWDKITNKYIELYKECIK